MRVLYYSPALLSPGGGGSHARGLRAAFERLGYDVLAIPQGAVPAPHAPPKRSPLPEFIKLGGREVRARIRHRHAAETVARVAAFGPQVAVMRRGSYDLTCDALARSLRCSVVAEVNAVLAAEASTWGERIPSWERARERALLERAALVSCVSAEVADDAARLGVASERLRVIENGVDDEMFSPGLPVDPSLADWASSRTAVVGYSGSVGALHDIDTLLFAADAILAHDPGVGFVWIGLAEAQLPASASSRVRAASRFSGPVAHERVPGLLAASDVCWGAFNFGYGSPLKVYEYAALGLPVVVAGEGMPARVALDAGGVAVPRGDAAALAAAVIALLGDPGRREAIGAGGRAWVEGSHTWLHVARAMLEGVVA